MKVFSVSEALNAARPMIEFRGKYYKVRDLTLQECIMLMAQVQQMQESLEEEAREKGLEDVSFENLTGVLAVSLTSVLEDFPKELAQTVTEREWEAINLALAAARELPLEVLPEEMTAEEILNEQGGTPSTTSTEASGSLPGS